MEQNILSKFYAQSEKIVSRTFLERGAILSEFFRKRVQGYEEPRAKRVPKGTKKGFPRKKIWAVFLAVIGYTPKQIFDYLITMGVRYGSIKNWCVEPDFLKTVREWRDEITTLFVNRLVEFSETTGTVFLEGDKPAVLRIFGKTEDYGRELSQQIASAVIARLNEEPKYLVLLHTANQVLSIFYESFKSDSTLKRVEQDTEDYVSIHVLCRVFHSLKKNPAMLHDSPEKARWLLDMFARFVNLWAIETNIPMKFLDRLINNDEWITDDLRFMERVGLRMGRTGKKDD